MLAVFRLGAGPAAKLSPALGAPFGGHRAGHPQMSRPFFSRSRAFIARGSAWLSDTLRP